ncbi:hypothetical protein EDB80DRAFT_686199 [Ilyonectria destructans]|nr:hypothetical protein EDB80DRAFT_686199 [Ilyonectria destructans]
MALAFPRSVTSQISVTTHGTFDGDTLAKVPTQRQRITVINDAARQLVYTSATPDIQKVLQYSSRMQERGGRPVDVLVYIGVTDIICNAGGVLDALRTIHWTGRTPFRGAPWQELPWSASSGGRASRAKAVPNLWLVEVEEAGHMKADGSMRGDYTEFPLSSGRDSEQEQNSLGGGEL